MKPKNQSFAALLFAPLLALADAPPLHSQPASICHDAAPCQSTHHDRVTRDTQGRIVRKIDADGNVTERVYHPRTGKLILVLTPHLGGVLTYHYDDAGRLISAVDQNQRLLEFGYGRSATVERLTETNGPDAPRREVRFKYGPHGKPVEIRLAGVGKIGVEYDHDDEISRIDTRQGARLTLQVMDVFRHFLAVLRAAQTDERQETEEYSISRSIEYAKAKRRQCCSTASEADKVID